MVRPSLVRKLGAAANALIFTMFGVLCLASSAVAQCGQEYHAVPAHSATPGGPPLAVGDSVLADAVPLLVRYGFEADGMVCRQMSQGLALIQARGSRLPHLVVVALGTNGEVTPHQIDTALSILGPNRTLGLVTPHGGVSPSSPAVIRAAAAAHPGQIVLLDWDRLVEGHPDWLASDGVHLGGPSGMAGFAQLVASVLPGASSSSAEAEIPAEHGTPPTTHPSPAEGTVQPGTPITIQPPPGHRSQSSPSPRPQIFPGAIPALITPFQVALMEAW